MVDKELALAFQAAERLSKEVARKEKQEAGRQRLESEALRKQVSSGQQRGKMVGSETWVQGRPSRNCWC